MYWRINGSGIDFNTEGKVWYDVENEWADQQCDREEGSITIYIKIGIVLTLHFNPWVEASAGGLLVPEGLYSPVAKYFGICLKIRIWIKLSSKK